MPSFGESFSLRAFTAWKARRSKNNDDAAAEIEKERAAIEVTTKAAKSFIPGSIEYFDAIAHIDHYRPSNIARRKFLTDLIHNLAAQKWRSFDKSANSDRGFKVLDYGAGSGILSHALAPHVAEIVALDKSSKMVLEYNEIVAQENKTGCRMKAVRGDLTSYFLTGEKVGIEDPREAFVGFDMVAMCLTVDFLTRSDADTGTAHAQLVGSLETITNLINFNGTLLIIDVEKCDFDEENHENSNTQPSPRFIFTNERKKYTGSGSREIVKALEELGMEDIDVVGDQHFQFDVKQGKKAMLGWMERYFLLKAKRGMVYEERFCQRQGGLCGGV